jgi:hypothetical protein
MPSINRRRLLAAALARPAGPAVALLPSRSPAAGTSDAALLAAEQRAAEARARQDAFRSSISYDGDMPVGLLEAEYTELDFIHASPAATLAGAAAA